MIKNKDGSYNKISFGILLGIGVIGIIMLMSILTPNIQTIDFTIMLEYCGLIISGCLLIYFGYKILSKRSSTPKSIPINNIIQKENIPVNIMQKKAIKKIDIINKKMDRVVSETKSSHRSSLDIVPIIITLVTFIVIATVGITVVNSIQSALPTLQDESPLTTTQNEIINMMDFNLIPIIIIIGVGMMIFYLLFGIVR